MAGFFSLKRGNNNNDGENQQNNIPPSNPTADNLFWYNNQNKNDDVVSTYRGFEIWNQHQQQQQQQQFLAVEQQDLYSSAAALGVGPSRGSDERRSNELVAASGGISCQDCGNQAKKDCPHVRCRTCCKSRGFDCQTHVKSTWVPAARRRERQQQQHQHHGGDVVPHRDHNNNNKLETSLACTRLPTNPSLPLPAAGLLEEVNFPAMVSSEAEFRCVRVSSIDESEEEYAYSTAVKIGGHVFRGILYDYGPDGSSNYMGGGNTSSSGVEAAVQPLNLISGVPSSEVVGAIVDPCSLYPAPINTFMPPSGTQFFPHPRST